MALTISVLLWALSFGQAWAGFCPAASCSVTLINSNSVGIGTPGTVDSALTLKLTSIDLNLADSNRIDKTDLPGTVKLSDNLGVKMTFATFEFFNPQELSLSLGNETTITDVRQLGQQFTARGGTGPTYSFTVARVPEPASLALLASGLFLALGLLRWKRAI
jgi:hypothetical protein